MSTRKISIFKAIKKAFHTYVTRPAALHLKSYILSTAAMGTATTPTKRWYHWYSPDDTPEERKLVLKLDLLIVPYAFVVYWVKYIDQGNISKSITRTLKL